MPKASNDINQLFEQNQKLVYFIINKHFSSFQGDEDIVQAGMVGLWKACKYYNSEVGKLSALATKCIRNEILMELRSRFRDINNDLVSLNQPVGEEPDLTLADAIADPRDDISAIEFRVALEKVKLKLSDRDAMILDMYVDGLRQQDIAETLNLTRANVSRIMIQKIRPMLRKFLG